ncbi:MAG: hypothetical protein A3H61_01505 [Candidatus Jacksonbacteria bacterium RIFCSPLOWO2_02_FULL_44_20]|uniref:Uncharacterized protein n=1 Tax=Candidatus Jacksonbacteria bacterium RIFCSPLOWO2_02_FULL_44_20 TaxID=1798460 RepID=A0A1G2A854_9BACT|nr:MAG: hypothetical protein A3H61_01505 [Candidatus Jacksonbacteria bacterium RIFCSPLOWO2_02_FULL_44_20]
MFLSGDAPVLLARNSAAKTPNPKPARIPPRDLAPRGREISRVRIEAPRTAQKLLGQNPEIKTPFPFSRKNSPPPNQKCKECFFRGCGRTRQCVGLSPNHLFWK